MQHLCRRLSLSIIALLLLGFVLADKGFAYIGVPPVYISEVALAAVVALFLGAPDFRILFASRLVWLIVVLNVWCLVRTAPYIEEYGIEAFRDAVIYGYSIVAFIIASYLMSARAVQTLSFWYGRASTLCVILMPVLLMIQRGNLDTVGDTVPLITLKPGDVAVHMAGAIAFRLLGLWQGTTFERHPTRWLADKLFWIAWLTATLWVASQSRAAILAVASGLFVVTLFGFGRRLVLGTVAVLMLTLVTLAAFDIRVDLERREVSAAQIVANVTSIFSDERLVGSSEGIDALQLEMSAEWRLSWWGDIVDYVLLGDYFWTGKGFGVNLADDDGYQVDPEERLRSPHNGHLTILARAGVPGLGLWALFQIAFAVGLVRLAARMRRSRAGYWQRLNLWILAYWLAAMVNIGFDVYLEGPQGGIWFWSIIGFGLAAQAVQQRPPALPSTPVPLAAAGVRTAPP